MSMQIYMGKSNMLTHFPLIRNMSHEQWHIQNKILGQHCLVEYFCNHSNVASATEKQNFEFNLNLIDLNLIKF